MISRVTSYLQQACLRVRVGGAADVASERTAQETSSEHSTTAPKQAARERVAAGRYLCRRRWPAAEIGARGIAVVCTSIMFLLYEQSRDNVNQNLSETFTVCLDAYKTKST